MKDEKKKVKIEDETMDAMVKRCIRHHSGDYMDDKEYNRISKSLDHEIWRESGKFAEIFGKEFIEV